jgi:TetR/AcrR family transcriptional regulator
LAPRSTEQNEKIRAERIEEILKAAIEVYVEKGFMGTEMGDIAKKAGVAFYLKMAQAQPVLLKFYRKIEEDMKLIFDSESEQILADYTKNTHEPLIQAFKQAIEENKFKQSDPRIMVHIYRGSLTGALEIFSNEKIEDDVSGEKSDHIIDLIFNGISN